MNFHDQLAVSIASPGWGLAPLWKAQRLSRLKARGNIRTPHTRQLWMRYYRGDLHERHFCI